MSGEMDGRMVAHMDRRINEWLGMIDWEMDGQDRWMDRPIGVDACIRRWTF